MIFVIEGSKKLFDQVRRYANERTIPNVRIIFNRDRPGISQSRNLGIERAKGEILAFIDDDTLLPSNWGKEMVRAYDIDDSIIGVTGPTFPLWDDVSMNWFPKELYWIISCSSWCGWKGVREVRNTWGHNMSFKKEAIDLCGPFSTSIGYHSGPIPEDVELSMRIKIKTGKRIIYVQKVSLWHKVHKYRLNNTFILERSWWIGRTRRILKRYYPRQKGNLLNAEHDLLRSILGRLFPSILKELFRNPILAWRKVSVTFFVLFFVAFGYFLPGVYHKLASGSY